MATHSSNLAWRIPWTEEPGRLQSMELQRVRHDWATITHRSLIKWITSFKWIQSTQSPRSPPTFFRKQAFPHLSCPVCQGLGTLLTTGGGPAAFEMGLSWPRMQCHLERELLASVPYWYLIDTCMRACSVASVVSDSVRPYRLWPARLLCPWDSPGKNTGVSCQVLLLGIFPTRGSKPESPALAGGFFTTEPTEKPQDSYLVIFKSITCWNDNIPNKPVLSNTYY